MNDPRLEELLRDEDEKYLSVIDLIAASNAPTSAVRCNATWGVAQFRSAEGYPGRRPYAGQTRFDEIEKLAIERACAVFESDHANVQPLSGSMANLAAYRAVLQPGDTLLTMAMHAGGHLSHGHPKHIASQVYRVVHYQVDRETELLDYDHILEIAKRERPRAIVAGYSAYPRAVNFRRFGEIAEEVGAVLIGDISHTAGLVAAGVHDNPYKSGAIVTTSVEKTLRGTRGGLILCSAQHRPKIDGAVFPGLQSSVGLANLVSLCGLLREATTEAFREYQVRTLSHARTLAAELLARKIPLVTGGTDTHLVVLNVGAVGLSGKQAEMRLEEIGILSNRNLLPFDTRTAFEASGLRLGTPTIAARGYEDMDVREVADIVSAAVLAPEWNRPIAQGLRERVRQLSRRRRQNDTLRDLELQRPLIDRCAS